MFARSHALGLGQWGFQCIAYTANQPFPGSSHVTRIGHFHLEWDLVASIPEQILLNVILTNSDNALFNSFRAPTKFIRSSDLSCLTAPLRFTRPLNALIKEELSTELAVSRWTLLYPIHLNNTPYRLTSLPLSLTMNGPK